MEFIIWFVFAVSFALCVLYPFKVIKTLRGVVKRKQVEPVKTKTLAEAHAEDHAWWEAQARELLQANCSHVYHHQKWYTCINCGQDEPWQYAGNCSCRYETVHTLGSAVIEYALVQRTPSCEAHGKDHVYHPLSERKQGPYGSRNGRFGVIRPTIDLQGTLKVRKIRYEEFTVSPSKGNSN